MQGIQLAISPEFHPLNLFAQNSVAEFAATMMAETVCRSVKSSGIERSATAKSMIFENPPLTIREAAEFIDVSVGVMRAMVRRKEVQGFKLGGQWRIHRNALTEYLLRQIAAAGGRQHRE